MQTTSGGTFRVGKMSRFKSVRVLVLVAVLCLPLWPRAASASTPQWIDGQFAYQYDTYCDLIGGNTTETSVISYVGYYGAIDLSSPTVGTPYRAHIVTGAAGNGCYQGYQLVDTEITPPPNTGLLFDAGHTPKCYLISGTGAVSDVTSDPLVDCVQTQQLGIHGGQYELGQRKIPTGAQIEIDFWLQSSAVLKGSSTATDKMYGYVTTASSTPFTQTPYQWVWVSLPGQGGTPSVDYPNPSTTKISDTTAHIETYVNVYGSTGNIYFDIGLTIGYGYTTAPVPVPAGYSTYGAFADITGLTPGTTYHWRGRFVTSGNVTYTGVDQTFSTTNNGAEVLPFVANAAYGGYTTTLYAVNAGNVAAHFSIVYFDQNGNPVGVGDSATVPVNGTWTVSQNNGHSFAVGQAGSGILYSDQPLAAFVNEFAPGAGDATSYTAVESLSWLGSTLYAPAIARNAYGGYTTGIGLVNLSSGPANIVITYRDSGGNVVKEQGLPSVPAHAYRAAYSGVSGGSNDAGLPDQFAGTATITSDNGVIAAIVNEVGPGGQFSSYYAVAGGATSLDAPAALKAAYGGYNTGMGIQNTTGTAGSVTVTYYNTGGGVVNSRVFAIAANAYLGVYQGGADGPAANGAYTAAITSTVAIAAIVNEVAPTTGAAQQSTSYNTLSGGGSPPVDLPLVENVGADGWNTGLGIMNTGATTTTVTVTYYDASTGAMVGTPQSLALAPNAFWGLYQPTGGLPGGTRANAAVTTSNNGPLSVICNESNASKFMSYSGQ